MPVLWREIRHPVHNITFPHSNEEKERREKKNCSFSFLFFSGGGEGGEFILFGRAAAGEDEGAGRGDEIFGKDRSLF